MKTCERCDSLLSYGKRFCSYSCVHPNPKNRFLSFVRKDDSGCWIWTGSRTGGRWSYGRINWDGSARRAHRVSYELFNGKFDENKMVLHRCDNPPCVNPDHLFLGTAKINLQDCISKGRYRSPIKYSEKLIAKIRQEHNRTGASCADLQNKFGVSARHIRDIISNKWRKTG